MQRQPLVELIFEALNRGIVEHAELKLALLQLTL